MTQTLFGLMAMAFITLLFIIYDKYSLCAMDAERENFVEENRKHWKQVKEKRNAKN